MTRDPFDFDAAARRATYFAVAPLAVVIVVMVAVVLAVSVGGGQ